MTKSIACLLAGAALLPAVAVAQNAPAASQGTSAQAASAGSQNNPAQTDDSSTDIVVTAQKRSERLKDVPAAVTAVTSDTLQALNATKLEDYVARAPGLVVAQVGGATASTQLSIRGLNTGPGSNPTVGVYIDDSPFGASNGIGGFTVPDLDPQDLARVEVLRGPQGTLYGASSLGGLLKYVTAEPDTTNLFGRIQVDGSTVDGGGSGYGMRASLNVPLDENAALRISGYNRRDPGYIDNVLLGERDVNDTRFYGGRVALLSKLGEGWKVRLSGLFQHYDGSAPVVDYNSTTFRPVYGDLKQSRARGSTEVDQDIGAASLSIEGDLGFATLTSVSTYNRQVARLPLDYSTIFGPGLAPFGNPALGAKSSVRAELDKYTQEVRLASPAEDTFSWQLGAFYTLEKQRQNGTLLVIDQFTGATITLPFVGSVLGTTDVDSRFREVAAFGDVTYRFSTAFDVTAGLRYSQNKQRNNTVSSGVFGVADIRTPSDDDSVTFLVSPRLRIDPDTMVYARVASGYRPGGPNAVAVGFPRTYGPDRVTDYEVGLKSDLLHRRLSLEVSGFWIDWKNIQVQRFSTTSAYIDNGSKAVSRGFELSSELRPVRGLSLYANLAFTDAHLTQDFPAASALGRSGDRLPLTARWSGGAGGTFSTELFGDWKGDLGVDWRYNGPRPGAFPNPGQVRFQFRDYHVVDLRAGISNDRLAFILFARNVGDARGQSSDVNFNVGLTSVSILQPRTFGISASAKF